MSKIKAVLSQAAAEVRTAVRKVRKNFSTEYLHTTLENVIDDLDERYPQSGKGGKKLALARVLLNRILGRDYVDDEWSFLTDLISGIVAIRKA